MDPICKDLDNIQLEPKKEKEKDKKKEIKKGKKLLPNEKNKEIKKDTQLLLPEECDELSRIPNINPLTGKPLNPNIKNGAYSYFVKECKKIIKDFEKYETPTRGTVEEIEELTEKERKKIMRLQLKTALKKALVPILHSKDSFDNRMHFTKVVRKYLSNIQSCITSSKNNPTKISLNEKTTKGIQEKIIFDKRIGSESVYGTAYLNMGKGLARLLKFSIKIMSTRFSGEVDLLKKMSSLVENGITPNMPITYSTLICDNPNDPSLLNNPNANKLIKEGKYYVVLNELANGDLHHFFKYKYKYQDYESIILQIIFSLRAFHNLGVVHNDTHLGNFLWHKITPGGFWQYQYKDTIIYVPNTGYLLVLWDPGLASKELNVIQRNKDTIKTLSLIDSIPFREYYINKKMKGIPNSIPIKNLIHGLTKDRSKNKDAIIELLLNQLKLKPVEWEYICYKDDLTNTLPANSKVINPIPYPL